LGPLKTSEKGIILGLSSDITIDCYAGLLNREDHDDQNCAISRAG